MLTDHGIDQEHLCGGTPDDLPEPRKGPKTGEEYTLVVAVGYDGRHVVVVDAPEEFVSFASETDGSYYFRDGLSREYTPGLHEVRVRFVYQPGQGEAGSHDPGGDDAWFEEV
jgi:hypothetical protein